MLLKKVLFLIESLSGGGAEKVLTDLVKNIDKLRFDITVMTVVNTGVYINEVKLVCNYKSFLPNPKGISSNFKKIMYKLKYKLIYTLPPPIIYRWFIKDKYDVEIAFIEGFVTKIISSSNNKKSRKIAWVHVDPINRDYADNYFRNYRHHVKSYKVFDNILCVSQSVADAFNKKFNLKKKATVQYNPVDKESILLKSTQNVNIHKDRITMVTVGRLVNQKGYDRLIKVCKRLKDDGFNFYLWILGEGEQRSILEKYIKDNCLEDMVKLMGFQSNPYPFVRMADFFVCSSRAEGFSTVATEAIILGKPVITTNCAGMRELLGENKYGIIVDNNCEALYLALKDVLTDKGLLKSLEYKANKRSKDFNIKTSIDKIQCILEIE